jgi:hypothetical protein
MHSFTIILSVPVRARIPVATLLSTYQSRNLKPSQVSWQQVLRWLFECLCNPFTCIMSNHRETAEPEAPLECQSWFDLLTYPPLAVLQVLNRLVDEALDQ